ncbi:MAG: carbohydrate binding family 9 domain-containing protein [Polyangiaceae bacterium]|nr:carbohydrate binding family 9 domain-containing protein [Polyangiaceae bacterium]
MRAAKAAMAAALLGLCRPAVAQQTFAPPAVRPTIGASRASGPLRLDGQLNEGDWARTAVSVPFLQADPAQGQPATEATEARLLFDDNYLYVGVEARDRAGEAGLRAPDLRRDFDSGNHDAVELVFDTLRDGRTATAFLVNPYGVQADLQALDDQLFEPAWDGVWRVATSRGPGGWTAEFAIPWKTLRYAPGTRSFGLQIARRVRRRNEVSGWSPWPRAFSPYRLGYAGSLTGIEPPRPPLNLLVRPYAALRFSGRSGSSNELRPDGGGEVRWAPTPNATVDLTVNTDFAEAEVDRQVINLQRSNVFFPERRQFFLESASVFRVGDSEYLEPFFSRRIGLSDDGRRLPIDAGARAVWRSRDENAGALFVRTRPTGPVPGSEFAVARYSRNLGESSRVGAFLTARRDDARAGVGPLTNVVPGLDGLYRKGQFTLQGMASASSTDGGAPAPAGYVAGQFESNQFYTSFSETYVNERYDARTGFVARGDAIRTRADFFHDWRPTFLPHGLRALRAYGNAQVFHRASDGSPQEASAYAEPIWFHLDTSDDAWFSVEGAWQSLDEPFSPLRGVTFPAGEYSYGSLGAVVRSDASRKVGFEVRGHTGNFYSASWQRARGILRVAPIPHLSAFASYELSRFADLPDPELAPRLTHLFQSELRLAATPKLQLAGLAQYNSDAGVASGNARLSWEFEPLSFVYLVYTDARRRYPGEDEPRREQQLLLKINYSYQL